MSFRRAVLLILLAILLVGGWWGYRLIWGRPLQIAHFYERIFIEQALDSPQLLSQIGLIDNSWLDFHSGKLDDASPAATERNEARLARDYGLLKEYDPEGETQGERLSSDILGWWLDDQQRGSVFRYHDYPVNQLFGVQSELPDFMVHIHQVIDRRSANRYVERLRAFGPYFDQLLESLKLRETKGILPPRFVVTEVLTQMRSFTDKPPAENLLYVSFTEKLGKLDSIDATDKTALLDQTRQAIETIVYPAYAKLIDYETGLEGRARTTDGVWALPDGDAYYAWRLRDQTTSDMSPAEVHALGLAEVARIQAELLPVLDAIGAAPGEIGARIAALTADKRYHFPNDEAGRAAMLDRYRQILGEMTATLPNYFAVLPQAKLTVEAVPAFKASTAPGAYYNPGALDGSRPGTFFANVSNTDASPKWGMKTDSYHEGVPGHHLQLSLQAEMQNVPTFRKVLPFTAYMEGWALYSERLAWEIGFEKDPLDNLGRLQAEMLRAVRLVVDTGIHFKHWTREQAISYMVDMTGMEQGAVTAEIERYIVDPGQACAYKVGMVKILSLREAAKQALGERFDLKEFHRAVLQDGAEPLEILDRRVHEWINSYSAAG
jgi:uncharacterized protein (DUF885 family)